MRTKELNRKLSFTKKEQDEIIKSLVAVGIKRKAVEDLLGHIAAEGCSTADNCVHGIDNCKHDNCGKYFGAPREAEGCDTATNCVHGGKCDKFFGAPSKKVPGRDKVGKGDCDIFISTCKPYSYQDSVASIKEELKKKGVDVNTLSPAVKKLLK